MEEITPHKPTILVLYILYSLAFSLNIITTQATWCVVRSDASNQALQRGLDYACSFGADCAPIQSSGLCYLPNTMQNHASYAYNSYYQRRNQAPGSCVFSGSATIAKTDPSYGSCVYPATPSAAGGPIPPAVGGNNTINGGITTTPVTTPVLYPPPPGTIINPLVPNNGGMTPGIGSDVPDSDQDSEAASPKLILSMIPTYLMLLLLYTTFFQ